MSQSNDANIVNLFVCLNGALKDIRLKKFFSQESHQYPILQDDGEFSANRELYREEKLFLETCDIEWR